MANVRIDQLPSTVLQSKDHELAAMKEGVSVKLTTEQIVQASTHGVSAKTNAVDGDELSLSDSEASWALKKLTFANLKAYVLAGFASMLHAYTAKTAPVDADELAIADSASSFNGKKLTFANLKAWIVGNFGVSFASAQSLSGPQQSQAKTNIGLGNVDNTSDLNKPVSTATAAALSTKFDYTTNAVGTSGNPSYQKFPSGKIIQQGKSVVTLNASGDATITLPLAFPGGNFNSVVCSNGSSSALLGSTFNGQPANSSQFIARVRPNPGAVGAEFHWTAEGA